MNQKVRQLETARANLEQLIRSTPEKNGAKGIFHLDLPGINSQKSVIIKLSRICTNLIPNDIMVSSNNEEVRL